jgi:ABC-2 type transport system permease protein
MIGAWALFRAAWLSAASYRVRSLLSLAGIVGAVIPLFFIARALQPVVGSAIRSEGGQYFGFLLLGTIAMSLLPVAVSSLPNTVSAAIGSGTLESLLETPTGLAGILAGLVGYDVAFNTARVVVLLAAGSALGAAIVWAKLPIAFVVLALIVLAHVPFGLIGSAGVLGFRTAGPFPQGVLVLSSLLGGVYYPTHVIPGWLEHIARVVPLTYGLRAFRRVLMQGNVGVDVWMDLARMVGLALPIWIVGAWSFSAALRYARRHGQLSRY